MTVLIAKIALVLSMLMSGANFGGAPAPSTPAGPGQLAPADSPVANPEPIPLPSGFPHL